jgi:mevalonate kinase
MTTRAGSGRACGKLILFGEHAVVHGVAALVLGVRLGVQARAVEATSGRALELLGRRTEADGSGEDETGRAFEALLEAGGAPASLSVQVTGDLPPGVGLGFSAAAAVAIARAVEELAGAASDASVRERATAWERVFHGNPSGVDVAAAMHGGCIRFARGDGVRRVAVRAPLVLCVGLTGTRSSTRKMVEGVAWIKERSPAIFQSTLEGIAALVDNGIGAIEAGDAEAIGELMNLNQMMLAGWMLSTERLEELCALAREAGALGAKLTGAGGGGAMMALAGQGDEGQATAARVVAAWRERGYEGFVTELGDSPPAEPTS